MRPSILTSTSLKNQNLQSFNIIKMKKHIAIIALTLISLGFSNLINAQNFSTNLVENALKKNGKYAMMIQSSRHFISSVTTGEQYKTYSSKIQFEVVLIGEVVKDLAHNEELKPFIEKAAASGIRIVVCEFAMDRLGIQKSQYPTSVETTPNGYTYFFGLQELGFKTIAL